LTEFFFKVLAHNDTGQAAGHQGGIVIPKDLADFFPPVVQSSGPTHDIRLRAMLFVDGMQVASVSTRYQHQTWGGTRSPERRLTDNLGPLRNAAASGDILLFRKNLEDEASIELFLVKKGSIAFPEISRMTEGRRWGVLNQMDPPISQQTLQLAADELDQETLSPATAFSSERKFETSTLTRRARDHAFRRKVIASYAERCAFTARRFQVPNAGLLGLDAAHIVPVKAGGSDDPANGIALTKDLHWAFDRGLMGVDASRRVIVPQAVQNIPGNEFLRDLHGQPISEAIEPRFRALNDAFAWHREHVLIQ
jgi:putative restriction endonuclease